MSGGLDSGQRLRMFAGPPSGRFFYDRFLVVAAYDGGTSVWDVETGERLHTEPDIAPLAHHADARVFLTVLPNGTLRESRLTGLPEN